MTGSESEWKSGRGIQGRVPEGSVDNGKECGRSVSPGLVYGPYLVLGSEDSWPLAVDVIFVHL